MPESEKRNELRALLREMESVVVTLSGGVDSSLLARLAHEELGERALAVTAVSPSLAKQELEDCRNVAAEIGIRHLWLETKELENPDYASNPHNRCYYCKDELFSVAMEEASQQGYQWVLDGTLADDLKGHRPGYQAAQEHKVRSPFVECGFTKSDVREWAKDLGLDNWDKPALACLSSRFPTGTEITLERLDLIDRTEAAIREAGARQCRARYHGARVRIELAEEEMALLANETFRTEVDRACRELGIEQAMIDLQPYGRGSGDVVRMPLNADAIGQRLRDAVQARFEEEFEIEVSEDWVAFRFSQEDLDKLSTSETLRSDVLSRCRSLGIRYGVIDLRSLEPATV